MQENVNVSFSSTEAENNKWWANAAQWNFTFWLSFLWPKCKGEILEHSGKVKTSLTSPAMPHGHFAHPGFGDGGTGYCVLGWFLYNVPCSGLQTPLIATGFVSSGAGSPLTPLTHLAALWKHSDHRRVRATPDPRSRFNTGWRGFTGKPRLCVWSKFK